MTVSQNLSGILNQIINSSHRFSDNLFARVVLFQDDSEAVQKATSVAIAESILKMGLYYFHERAWYRYGKLGRS